MEESDKNIPHGYDVADATCQDEEVENRVHISFLVQTIEQGTGEIARALCDNPSYSQCRNTVDERLESNQHRQSHQTETDGFQMTMVFQSDKRYDGTRQSTSPNEAEHGPAPIALLTKGNEGDGGIGSGYMPVDGCMVPFA